MKQTERGFLLLTSHLGDAQSKPLTVAQFRTLANRVQMMEKPKDERELNMSDMAYLGYDGETAENILYLLSRQEQLDYYIMQGKRKGCYPIARNSTFYPATLHHRLGLDAPGCLWAKGDSRLLEYPAVALVGSRDLHPENEDFAYMVGYQAAQQGYVLVSGNARGADRVAQDACLEAGGRVVSIISDSLAEQTEMPGILYLSEDGFDIPFSSLRAVSRNRLIHAMGRCTFVAQCTLEKGGTWNGTVQNLKKRYSYVFCYKDGSAASKALEQMGAGLISPQALYSIDALTSLDESLF
ncbi:MAG: DNA-processing protein DprA [Oscillospiraceae bacterium]|nr:DNA-processing protein DprA [Oscillospiraceae bacterium]